jgi:hypothetical protein
LFTLVFGGTKQDEGRFPQFLHVGATTAHWL